MLFAIIGEDHPDSLALRRELRPAHLARIDELVEQGRIVLAGPFPAVPVEDPGDAGFTGSLIVAEFDSFDAAKVWADSDPYTTGGVFSRVEVKPFRQTLP